MTTPITPIRLNVPSYQGEAITSPGGMAMDIVLTPALKPAPRSIYAQASPIHPTLEDRLSAAEMRKASLEAAKAANITEKLAKVDEARSKKGELEAEWSTKAKEELEFKLRLGEENRNLQISFNKQRLAEHLTRVDRAQKELEIHTEAARLATEFALNAKMMRAEENKEDQLEQMLKKFKEHEAYVAKVRHNQETRLKPYFAELEENIKEKLTETEKRREEAMMKVVETARGDIKRADVVRQNKAKLQEHGEGAGDNTVPESA